MTTHYHGDRQSRRHKITRKIAPLVVVVLAISGLLLAACAPQTVIVTREVEVSVVETVEVEVQVLVTPIPEPLPDVTMVAAHYAAWDTFNPLTIFGGNMVDTAQRVFSPLVALDLNYKPFGDLAESWDASADATVYTFHLREGVKFHDGEPFTAEDVVFSFHAAANLATGSAYASNLGPIVGAEAFTNGETDSIDGVRAVDDNTVEIELNEPDAYFLQVLAQIYILPEHILGSIAPEDIPGSDFSLNSPIGTGPYMLLDFDNVNQVVTYEAYRDYHWGTPKIKTVQWVHIPDPESQIIAFDKGEIDYAPWHIWNEGHFKQAIAIPSLNNVPRPWAFVGGININVSQPYFQDARVRQAMFHAIDRRQFLSDTGYDRLYDGFFDLAAWAKNSDVSFSARYPYDPDRARELLAEAGWDPNQEIILYTTVTGADPIRLAIQQMLGDVGMKVVIQQVETAVTDKAHHEDRPPTYDIYTTGMGLNDPGLAVWTSLRCDAPGNFFGYCDPELDALIEQDRVATTLEERVEILQQVEAILLEDPPLIPLTYSPQYVGFSNEWDIPRYAWYTFSYMHEWAPKP